MVMGTGIGGNLLSQGEQAARVLLGNISARCVYSAPAFGCYYDAYSLRPPASGFAGEARVNPVWPRTKCPRVTC